MNVGTGPRFQALLTGLSVQCQPHPTVLLLMQDLAVRVPSDYINNTGVFQLILQHFQRETVRGVRQNS